MKVKQIDMSECHSIINGVKDFFTELNNNFQTLKVYFLKFVLVTI